MSTFVEVRYNQSTTVDYFPKSNTGQRALDKREGLDSVIMLFVQVGLVNAIAIVGVTGNTINIIVLRKHGVAKDGANVLLVALSVFDLLYSVMTLTRQIPFDTLMADIELFNYLHMMFTFYSIYTLDQVCIIVSVTITSAIAIERFVAVFFPFKVASIFTPFRAKLIVIFIVVYVIGTISPLFRRFKMFQTLNAKNNMTVLTVTYADWWVTNNMVYYSSIMVNSSFGIANIAIVFVCGTTIAVKLAHTVHIRQRLTGKTSVSAMKAHKLLLLVCGTCFLVFAPTTAVDTALILGFSVTVYYSIAQSVLFGIHASINFVIYVAMSRKFYITYRKIFCRF